MLINLTELFSRDGKEKTYTCDIDMEQLHTTEASFDIVSREPVELRIRNLGERKPAAGEGKAYFADSL
ncbi:hypothetical protein [Clostridium sp. AN503]|uniref:hypothetical protein n=1 Tax=Clostridium sp. AN503 TaxID=3160598 RepID=UPI003459B20D